MANDDGELRRRVHRAADSIDVPDRSLRRSTRPMPLLVAAAAAALVLLLAVALGQYLRRDQAPVASSPTPTTTASTSPTQSASPSASPSRSASPSAAAGAFENAQLGYRVTLPPPWRHSDCLSTVIANNPVNLGQDLFTVLTEQQEYASPPSGTNPGAAWQWATDVAVDGNPDRLSAMDWVQQGRAGGAVGQRVEPTTIAGEPAVKVTGGARFALAYYVPGNGRMYAIGYTGGAEPKPAGSSEQSFETIARSLMFVAPKPIAGATPASAQPPAAATALADALAAAFASRDADAIGRLVTPKCWLNTGYYQSEGVAVTREALVNALRDDFAKGLRVTVEPRPVFREPPTPGAYWIWSTWRRPGQPDQNVQLTLGEIDGRWYWAGALYNAPR